MRFLRHILWPLAIIYGIITSIRNFLYNHNYFRSHTFSIPVIAVGNLSVGGTGKTPMVEYLIRLFSDSHKVAVLSRGYKRKSKGFILANTNTTAEELGDEPFQYFSKFKNILVAVDTQRKNGIEQLLRLPQKPEIILLDDAFQHRKVKANFYILLTAYSDLFTDDFMLPVGNLREVKSGAQRAQAVVVSKCPNELSEKKQTKIKQAIQKHTSAPVFFSTIAYDSYLWNGTQKIALTDLAEETVLSVAGIAKPKPFFDYLQSKIQQINCLTFADHHDFTANEIAHILQQANGKKIITTEKDFMRLQGKIPSEQLFYLPIQTQFLSNEEKFVQLLNCVVV